MLHGLHISPDLDTVTYTLAGAIDPERGWGLAGETWQAMEALGRYGGADAGSTSATATSAPTSTAPTACARARRSPTVTAEIAAAWDLGLRLLPVTDDRAAHQGHGRPTRARSASRSTSCSASHDVAVSAVRFDGRRGRPPRARRARRHRRGRARGHRPVEPDRVDRPGARRARRARRGRGPPRRRRGRVAHHRRRRAQGPGRPPAARARPRGLGRRRGPPLRTAGRHARRSTRPTPTSPTAVEAEGIRCVVAPDRSCDGRAEAAALAPYCAGRVTGAPMSRLEIFPIDGIPEVAAGDDLAGLIADGRARRSRDGDVVVVTQKIVSKAEGAMVRIDPDDPRGHKALVEDESVRIVRRRGDLIISETRHGFVCANAGVDLSNVDEGWAALLPDDSDRSARRIRDGLRAAAGVEVGGHRLRHVRPPVAPWAHRRRHRLRRHRRRGRPARHRGQPRPRAPGHRGVRRRRARGRRRARHGQGDRRSRRRRPRRRPAWLGRGEVRAEVVRPSQEDLFR